MTLVKVSPNLTRVDGVDDKAQITHQGMASWGLWGQPECGLCVYAKPKGGKSMVQKVTCNKAASMMNNSKLPAFPADAFGCRYHEIKK